MDHCYIILITHSMLSAGCSQIRSMHFFHHTAQIPRIERDVAEMSAGSLAPEWQNFWCVWAFHRLHVECLFVYEEAMMRPSEASALHLISTSAAGWWWGLIVYWSWRWELSKCWRRSFGTWTTARRPTAGRETKRRRRPCIQVPAGSFFGRAWRDRK